MGAAAMRANAKSRWYVAKVTTESEMTTEALKWASKHGMDVTLANKGGGSLTWWVHDNSGEIHGDLTATKSQFEFAGYLP